MNELLTLKSAVVVGVGLIACITDVRSRRIPNVLTFGAAAAGLIYGAITGGWSGAGSAALGWLIGAAAFFIPFALGGLGAGDVKLLAAFGTLLGPAGILAAFIRTAIVGGIIALIVATARGRVRATVAGTAGLIMTGGATATVIKDPAVNNRFPYAAAIAIGTALVAVGW
jgi:prepilin peptidase CpaA